MSGCCCRANCDVVSKRMLDVSNGCEQCVCEVLLTTTPKGALAGVPQGSQVKSCKIVTVIVNSLQLHSGLERHVWASKETRG